MLLLSTSLPLLRELLLQLAQLVLVLLQLPRLLLLLLGDLVVELLLGIGKLPGLLIKTVLLLQFALEQVALHLVVRVPEDFRLCQGALQSLVLLAKLGLQSLLGNLLVVLGFLLDPVDVGFGRL